MGSEQGCGPAVNAQNTPKFGQRQRPWEPTLFVPCRASVVQCQPQSCGCSRRQGTKTSISLFQWQETTTSKQSKLKSNGNTGSCQALGRLEPAPSHSYKNTVLQQRLRNTDPGIAQNSCPQGAGQPTPPPSSPNISRLGIAQQLSSQVHGGARQGGGQCVSQLPVQKL